VTKPPDTSDHEPAFDWGDSTEASDSLESPSGVSATKVANPGLLGVFGGLYVVWSVAWVLGIAATPPQPASSLLDAIMFQFGAFLAMVASPIWLGVVWWLTTESRVGIRVAWLVLGLVLLVPLPLILPVVLG
jgi:hypothetical protein